MKNKKKKKYLIIEIIYTTKDKKEEKEGVFTLPWDYTQVSTSQQLYFSNLVSQLGIWPSQLDPVTLSH